MAGFVFKLQSLLNIRTQLEETKKNEMGRAVQNLEKQKVVLGSIISEKARCIEEFNSKTQGKFIPLKLREYTQYISYLKSKIDAQKEIVKSAQNNVDKVREELLEMMKQREILEKLKEKQYKRYLQEEKRMEHNVIDEVVSFKHSIAE